VLHHTYIGYMTLSARKLVLRHMARFKGLLVRAQEDPLLPVKDEWNEVDIWPSFPELFLFAFYHCASAVYRSNSTV
jgi:hypothetical protein